MIFQVFWFSATFCAMKLQNWTGLTLLDVSIETFSFHFQTDRNLSFHFQNSADNVYLVIQFCVVVQPWSCVQLFATPWTAARQDFLSFTISRSLFKLMSIEWVMPFSYLILCSSLLLLLSNFPSIRVLFNELALCIRWLLYWSFSFSIVLPMNIQGWFLLGFTGLISLQSKGLSRAFSTIWKHQSFGAFNILQLTS